MQCFQNYTSTAAFANVSYLVPNGQQAITWTNANQYVWGHCSLVAPYGDKHFGQKWFQYWYDTMLAPGHYLN